MTVLSLDEAKEHLNLTTDVQDAELAVFIDAAEAAIAKRVGPLEPTDVTSVVDSGGGTLVLPCIPVISVTSVTAVPGFGGVYDASGLSLNGQTGVLSPSSNQDSFGFAGSNFGSGLLAGRYTVSYVAGREEVPSDILLAVKELVRHLWSTQRGGAKRPGSTDDPAQSSGYLMPYRVAELLAPHKTFGFGLV